MEGLHSNDSGVVRLVLIVLIMLANGVFPLGVESWTAVAVGEVPETIGPGTAKIVIHQYSGVEEEMAAFEAGALDIVDSPIPTSFLDAWTGPITDPRSIVTQGLVGLSSTVDLQMSELDMNSFSTPDIPPGTLNCPSTAQACGGTSDLSLRRALAFLTDRDTIVNAYADGRAVPLCGPAPEGQPGALNCAQLGNPPFDPTKALQTLYEGGWRDSDNDGILEAPNGVEVTLRAFARSDDPIRNAALTDLANRLGNMPNTFRDKTTGNTITVCPTSCRINIFLQHLPRAAIAPIVFRAIPPCDTTPCTTEQIDATRDWDLYSGSWGTPLDPDQSFFQYSSGFAPVGCGGGWGGNNPLNYVCNVDRTFDIVSEPQYTGRTYAEIVASAQATYRYGWGYNRTTGRYTGTMPTVPWYAFIEEKAAWLQDHGDFPLINPDGTRACWRGFVEQRLRTGLDNQATLTGLHLDNCLEKSGYMSYRGQGVLDWGFRNRINTLNPFIGFNPLGGWLWDQLAMQLSYESMLGRNPMNLGELVPLLAGSFGESTYNLPYGREANVAVFKFRDGTRWSDGQFVTAWDFKFSYEYFYCNTWTYWLIDPVFDADFDACNGISGIVVEGADQTRGVGGTVYVYFDDVGATLTRHVGLTTILPKHVWCNSWPDMRTDCAYPYPRDFPSLDFTKHVGTGPYVISECTGVDCTETITLTPNPYYKDGTRYWSRAVGISLQPDVNRDNLVNERDLGLLREVDPDDVRFDVDYRIVDKGSHTFPNHQGSGTLSVTMRGTRIDEIDRYIVERLILEGELQGLQTGITWPPGRHLTYNWPDTDRDDDVDLDDVIRVYLSQFQSPTPVSDISIRDVDYDMDIDLDDLILTFLPQFSRPIGVT